MIRGSSWCRYPIWRCYLNTCIFYLPYGQARALADIRHTEAEAAGTSERIALLEVKKTWLAQITVSSHHILLRMREQVRLGTRWNTRKQVRYWRAGGVYLADAGAAWVSVDAAWQVTLTANTLRKISVSKRTTVTLLTCKPLLAHALTCKQT